MRRKIKQSGLNVMIFFIILLLASLLLWILPVTAQTKPPLDILLVLDNSGSMKTNNPQFMTRAVVSNFLQGLGPDSRVGLIVFAENSSLLLPLTSASEAAAKDQVAEALNQLNYEGKYTNSPMAIERAIYELKQHGQVGAEKLIIFMTDGIVDTGDEAQDLEKQRWLKEELAIESKTAGIRIFGVAFTEAADYELIQTLGRKTDGGYYRVYQTGDIQGAFDNIQQTLSKPLPQPTGETVPPPSPLPLTLIILGVLVLVIVVVIIVIIILKQPKQTPDAEEIPPAFLEDLNRVINQNKSQYKLTKKVTKIGRDSSSMDICINQPTVSGLHATIEYRNGIFYLVDQNSRNHTFLVVDQKRNQLTETRLKPGDIVAFDIYEFKFTIPGQVERGKTQLSLAPDSGGTELRIESPEPEPEVKTPTVKPETGKKQGRKLQKVEIQQPPEAVPLDPEGAETMIKVEMCEFHPSFKAEHLCPICNKAFCDKCLVENQGNPICRKCSEADKGNNK